MKVYANLIAGALLFIAIGALSTYHSQAWGGVAVLSAVWLCISHYLTHAFHAWALSQIDLERRGDEIVIRYTLDKITFYDVHAIKKAREINRDIRRRNTRN